MKSVWMIVVLAVGILLQSCAEKPKEKQQVSDTQIKESLEKANRYLVNDEEEDIQNYIARHQLDMVSTGTGMRYQILQAGSGEQIKPGQTVTMEYVLNDITGDIIYSSENDGVMKAVVGCGDVVSGLDEALRHLHLGDVAKVIVPSHLAYGLLGDQKDIPPRSTLIYTIKIIKVEI
ncbi:MAG: FKBP-type peptidyl-prolyl cis-trans isomerase [Bacteroidales bacterium]|nr:FKBP-type peptidyl-prolyl cis-trans isomerase [Bacteroidales bacterium]